MRDTAADALENAVARMTPLRDGFIIEILYKPSITDNITNLHVFIMMNIYCTLWPTVMFSKMQP